MRKHKLQIIIGYLIILMMNAYYLTGVVNRSSLFTTIQYLFVFFYFFLLNGLILFYITKKTKKEIKRNLTRFCNFSLIAIILSALIIVAGGDVFNNHKYKSSSITITATGSKDNQSKSSEVWITGVKIDGNSADFQSLNSSYNSEEWELREGDLISHKNQPSTISFNFSAHKEIQLSFLKHEWSGIVTILDGEKLQQIDLYSQSGDSYIYTVNSNVAPFSYKTIFDYVMAFLFCLTIILILLMLSTKYSYAYGLMCSGIYFLLFIVVRVMETDKVTDILFVVMSFVVGSFLGKLIRSSGLHMYLQGKLKFLLMLIVVYTAFAGIGTKLFFETGIRDITFRDVTLFIISFFWFLPFIVTSFHMLVVARRYIIQKEGEQSASLRMWFLFFTIQLISGTAYLLAYFPANMSVDSISQWAQATGKEPLSDWHPVFHTIFNMQIISLYESPAAVALFQILFSSCVISSFLVLLYQNGFQKKWIIIFITIFSLLPNNGVNLVTIWKDIPYTISLLWLTLCLARLRFRGDRALTWFNFLSLTGSLVAVCLFRHNGIVPFILTLMFLTLVFIKNKNYKILGSILASILLVVAIKGAINSNYNVIPNPSGIKFVAPIHGIASVIYHEGKISSQAQKFMEDLMPIEDWKKLYEPFSASSYMFGNNYDVVNKLSTKETKEIITLYLETLYHNPSVVLLDRLTGANLMWDITQPESAYNYRYSNTVLDNDLGIQRESNFMTKLMDSLLSLSYKYKVFDVLMWRGGLYTVLGLILMLFSFYRKSWSDVLVFIPLLGNMISLVLSMSWQDYRYVYFEFYLIWFIIGTLICLHRNKSM